MAYKYIFDPIAADEYEDAFTTICLNPFMYRYTYKKLRELTLKKYPYNLIYFIDEDKQLITIISLYHHKRNPKGKYDKSKLKKK